MILLFLKTGAERFAALKPSFLKVIKTWNHRQAIKRLSSFDDHLLEDIGINRADIERAVNGSSINNTYRLNSSAPCFLPSLSKKFG